MGLVQQFRCPSGIAGWLAGALMAVTNTPLIEMVTATVAATDGECVLDIGFGPGVSLLLLASAAPGAALAGIDPSPVMVRMARRRTARLANPPELCEGTVAALPWSDGSFDAVCATNSVQLWEPLAPSLDEVRRVLRPEGRLVVGVHERAVLPAGGSAGRNFDRVLLPALQAAGFSDPTTGYRRTRGGQALLCRAQRPTD